MVKNISATPMSQFNSRGFLRSREVDPTHVQENCCHHEVSRPVVYGPDDVSERELGHDELHRPIGRSRISSPARHVVQAEYASGNHQDDECQEGYPSKTVKRVPVPNYPELVLLGVSEGICLCML